MRYVLVNDRLPFKSACCAFCTAILTNGYLRERATRILYCGFGCYTEHVNAANRTFGDSHAMSKLLPSSGAAVSSKALVLVGL